MVSCLKGKMGGVQWSESEEVRRVEGVSMSEDLKIELLLRTVREWEV